MVAVGTFCISVCSKLCEGIKINVIGTRKYVSRSVENYALNFRLIGINLCINFNIEILKFCHLNE